MNLKHDLRSDRIRHSRVTIWLISIAFITFGLWAANAPLDQIVRGPGQVVPSSNSQIIQSLEGGILSELMVREGDNVQSGQPLVRLDSTKFRGALQELETKVIEHEAKLFRLEQELQLAEQLTLPQHILEEAPLVAKSELLLFNSSLSGFLSSQNALEDALALQVEEVAMLEDLWAQQLVPEIDLLRAKQQSADAARQLASLSTEYQFTRATEYSETLSTLMELQANLDTRRDQLARTTILAPVDGTVNDVSISTVGGVIRPGEAILELTPLNDELQIDVRIRPSDVALIYPGMPATIKFTAYDFTIYGSFRGEVLNISADTFEDENNRDAEPYYKVLVEVDLSFNDNEDVVIRPGMLVDAELQVGQRTVLRYLLKPLFKTTEAFREP